MCGDVMSNQFTTSKLKKKFMLIMAEDLEIFDLLDGQPAQEPDDLINTKIFPHIKVDFTPSESQTYIGLKIDYPSVCKNELYKNYRLTIMILSNNGHLKTKTGDSRTDLLAEEIIELFNWNNTIGFTLELVSDFEDPFNENFYGRRLVFKSITSNSIKNGNKQHD